MSKENLYQFMNQIADSEELQARIGEEIEAESLIALGAECGCEFTAEDCQETAALTQEQWFEPLPPEDSADKSVFMRICWESNPLPGIFISGKSMGVQVINPPEESTQFEWKIKNQ